MLWRTTGKEIAMLGSPISGQPAVTYAREYKKNGKKTAPRKRGTGPPRAKLPLFRELEGPLEIGIDFSVIVDDPRSDGVATRAGEHSSRAVRISCRRHVHVSDQQERISEPESVHETAREEEQRTLLLTRTAS